MKLKDSYIRPVPELVNWTIHYEHICIIYVLYYYVSNLTPCSHDAIADNEDFVATRHSPMEPDYAQFRPNIAQLPLAVCGRPTVASPLYRPETERVIAEQQQEPRRAETKPRIWSLADIATSGTNTSSSSSSAFDGLNSSSRGQLGTLWATPTSLSPLLSTRFQPWTSCSTPSVHQPLSSSSLFQNGLFPVGGFLHHSPSNSKSPQPPRSDSVVGGAEMRSTLLLSPDRRTSADTVCGDTSQAMSGDPVPTSGDDGRRWTDNESQTRASRVLLTRTGSLAFDSTDVRVCVFKISVGEFAVPHKIFTAWQLAKKWLINIRVNLTIIFSSCPVPPSYGRLIGFVYETSTQMRSIESDRSRFVDVRAEIRTSYSWTQIIWNLIFYRT